MAENTGNTDNNNTTDNIKSTNNSIGISNIDLSSLIDDDDSEYVEVKEHPILKRVLHVILDILIIGGLVCADIYTKSLAVMYLKGKKPIVLIDGVFELNYLENRGAAFGIMQNMKIYFLAIAVIMVLFVLYCMIRMPADKHYIIMRICLILVGAGAVGNMIDRLTTEYVVDFFYFSLINFPIFNVADIYVTVACAVLILSVLFFYKAEDMEFLNLKKEKNEEQ
ncbi:MAG: signal peptidase II [Lachnospiraceae bacterium]|nr:signal peptidase II [Lachnospiraceae bacterium]